MLNIPYGLSKCFVYSESALSLQATSQALHLFKSGVHVHVILIESWLFTKRGKVESGTVESGTLFQKAKRKNGFSMLHLNMRSLPKNLSLLEDFITTVEEAPEIIAISETKLRASA